MSAEAVIAEIEALPVSERAKVFAYVDHALAGDDSWVPDSFRQGMADVANGRLTDMETVLSGAKPPSRP